MSASDPFIVAANDVTGSDFHDTPSQIATITGAVADAQRPNLLIEALVALTPDADATAVVVSLWDGTVASGTERQIWQGSATLVAAADAILVPVRYLDNKPPSAGLTYSLGLQVSGTGGTGLWTVYGFTVTSFPGGITPLASND